jgi:cobaltochelatase CobN
MRRWFEENNVWALEEIARRLVEAAERELWRPSEELLERLREVYGEIEGILEESIGEGEVQGSAIRVYTPEDDEHWKERLTDVEKAISLLKRASK